MTIAIFGNTFRPAILPIVNIIFQFFNTRGVLLLLDKELHQYFRESGNCSNCDYHIIDNEHFEADIALSIGGDGTFLNTAARIGSKNIPILGINIGRLGFLADVSGDEILSAMEAIMTNQLSISSHTLLQVSISDGRHIKYPCVLNDVSILKQDSSSMVSINTYLNSEAIHTYHADGLIVSTPTGSTAYSMSVGGPLIAPQTGCLLLSPVASHSLTVRPLVIPEDWVIDLEVATRSGCFQLSLDGRTMVLDQELKIRISKADYCIQVAKQMNHTFFDSLKGKLMWGLDKRN
jgi:NAD+ kinase